MQPAANCEQRCALEVGLADDHSALERDLASAVRESCQTVALCRTALGGHDRGERSGERDERDCRDDEAACHPAAATLICEAGPEYQATCARR